MMRERERCDRGQPDAFGILQQAFIRRMAFNMTPTKFPTEQILIASILATIAFLLIYMVYVSIKKSRAVLVNGVRDKSDNLLVVWTLLASLLLHIIFSYYILISIDFLLHCHPELVSGSLLFSLVMLNLFQHLII